MMILLFKNLLIAMSRIIGGHISIAGNGLINAHRACSYLGITGVQVHPSAPQRWNLSPYDESKATAFIAECSAGNSPLRFMSFHSIYLVNLATPDETKLEKAIISLQNDLSYARFIKSACDIELAVVFHVGSLKDEPDTTKGLMRASNAIIKVLENARYKDNGVKLCLEVSAGSGKVIGSDFESLAEIYHNLQDYKGQVGFALDTQHMWASGHDIADNPRGIIENIEETIGSKNLVLIHLNDSKTKLGSHVDRHANLGLLEAAGFDGTIGIEALSQFINQPELKHLPLLLETPNMKDIELSKNCYNTLIPYV